MHDSASVVRDSLVWSCLDASQTSHLYFFDTTIQKLLFWSISVGGRLPEALPVIFRTPRKDPELDRVERQLLLLAIGATHLGQARTEHPEQPQALLLRQEHAGPLCHSDFPCGRGRRLSPPGNQRILTRKITCSNLKSALEKRKT